MFQSGNKVGKVVHILIKTGHFRNVCAPITLFVLQCFIFKKNKLLPSEKFYNDLDLALIRV